MFLSPLSLSNFTFRKFYNIGCSMWLTQIWSSNCTLILCTSYRFPFQLLSGWQNFKPTRPRNLSFACLEFALWFPYKTGICWCVWVLTHSSEICRFQKLIDLPLCLYYWYLHARFCRIYRAPDMTKAGTTSCRYNSKGWKRNVVAPQREEWR